MTDSSAQGRKIGSDRGLRAVIAAARRRARRRRFFVAALMAASVAVAALALIVPHFSSSPTSTSSAAHTPAFAAQLPYVGIACRTPNGTRCGRVGIAVWMRHHVASLTASLGGEIVTLHDTTVGRARVRTYIGYSHLSRGELRLPTHWTGSPPRYFVLRLRSRTGGRVVTRTLRLQLHPGWG